MNEKNKYDEAAREQIEEMAKTLFSARETGDLKYSQLRSIAEDLYEDLYNEGYSMQSKWISVEERLPESGVLCLLCCDVKRYDGTHKQYVCDGFYAERFKEECYSADDECVTEYNEETDEYYLHEGWYEEINNWDEYSSIAIDDTVTHWMPLPEAPKMKGGAK